MVAEIIAGKKRAFDPAAIPAVCFTDPEIVVVGLSPEAAQRGRARDRRRRMFPFRANGRAMTLQDDDGFVRVVARADNHLVLGVQAVGEGVSELSAAFALAIEMGARLEDVAGHDPRASDAGRGVPRGRAAGAGQAAAYLTDFAWLTDVRSMLERRIVRLKWEGITRRLGLSIHFREEVICDAESLFAGSSRARCGLCRLRPLAAGGRGAFRCFAIVCHQLDDGVPGARQPRAQAGWRTQARQARSASRFSAEAGGREGRHHDARTGGRA